MFFRFFPGWVHGYDIIMVACVTFFFLKKSVCVCACAC